MAETRGTRPGQSANPLRALQQLGQSVWLDDIRRAWLLDGTLARLIADDGISGLTSNPAIFEKAIRGSHDYDSAIAHAAQRGLNPDAIYEELVIEDVGQAAALLRPVYEQTGGRDGYVSLEVSPQLAHNSEATIREARRLWTRVGQPNLMIKVPGTQAGLAAIRTLLAAGLNVNVTLLFSVARYRQVVEAFLGGLEDRVRAGLPIAGVASVASFFLSRIDSLVDRQLVATGSKAASQLRGQAAIASARLAYLTWRELFSSMRWKQLAGKGAGPQRLLWASTSTKDPDYSDVKYVDALIAPDTVNTLPFETLAAYRDHGTPVVRIDDQLEAVRALPAQLAALGIDLEDAAEALELDGVRKFVEPFERLRTALAERAGEHNPVR